jgi:hypothetical protein
MPEPRTARAVFSSEDFDLLRTAVLHYLQDASDQDARDRAEQIKFANLYHRLGRLG